MKGNRKRFWSSVINAVLSGVLIVGLTGCAKDYSRDQFTQLTLHKTESEVRTAVGEPSWISDTKPKTWTYYRRTFNAKDNNKDDYKATLKFATDSATGQDRVVNVEFGATAGG